MEERLWWTKRGTLMLSRACWPVSLVGKALDNDRLGWSLRGLRASTLTAAAPENRVYT